MKKIHKSNSSKRVLKAQFSICISFVLLIAITVSVVAGYSLTKSSTTLKDKVSQLIASIDVQMELNIDNYLNTIEKTGTLAFSSDPVYNGVIAYQYDPIKDNYSEYDKIQIEDAFSNQLVSLSLMENYCDFGVVYSDNHTVGKISKSTTILYSDKLYTTMDNAIGNSKKGDAWFSGYGENFIRIYYAKRMNEHAILVTSFYITELETIFARSENINDLTISLIDSNGIIIYSSKSERTGKKLGKDVNYLTDYDNSVIISNDDYIVSVNTCGDNWKIICSIPTSVVLAENRRTSYYTTMVAVIAAIIAVILAIIFTTLATRPVKGVVDNLNIKAENDQLTGIYNKISYENKCAEILDDNKFNDRFALFGIDIDNFKNVNDTQGHAFGDTVIVGVARIISSVFNEKGGISGRIGGDEFAVFLRLPIDLEVDSPEFKDYIMGYYESMKRKIGEFGKSVNYPVTLSVGVTADGTTYKEYFENADKALYKSKNSGKDRITFSMDLKDENIEK